MAYRLLITARDVAAALHLVQVAQAAMRDARFDVSLAAQDPAAEHFSRAGLVYQKVDLPAAKSAHSPEADALRAAADKLLKSTEPAAILAGLSTPFDAGLDEAVLAVAKAPTFLLQDFWGEQNRLLGRGADTIFAIDAEAARRNLDRFGMTSIIVGSARHCAYAGIDIPQTRARMRTAIGSTASERIVGFFGQALHQLPGYLRTVREFISCVSRLEGPIRIVLRPHPREGAEQRAVTHALFRDVGWPVVLVDGGPVEEALIACDVVCSLFSTCTYDTAYLNRFSASPVAVPLSLLFDEEIQSYCRQHVNVVTFPHHASGLIQAVHSSGDLLPALQSAATPAALVHVWQLAREQLPDPADAPRRILDAIAGKVS